MLVVSNLSGAVAGFGLLVRVLVSVAVGVAAYVATAVVMASRDRRPAGATPDAGPPTRPW